jgi:vancomycin resistance protein YoaR
VILILESKGKRITVILISILAGILILFSALIGFFYLRDNGRICNGVIISNNDVSRLSESQFNSRVEQIEKEIKSHVLTLDGGNLGKKQIVVERLGISFDEKQLYENAYQQGRTGNFFENALFKLKALFGTKTYLNFPFELDQNVCDDEIAQLIESAGGKMREHEIVIQADSVRIVPGKTGYVATGDYYKDISEAISNGTFQVKLEVQQEKPKKISVEELASQIDTEPINAKYKIENKKISFVESQNGRTLDKEDAQTKLSNLREDGGDVFLKVESVPAEITREQLEAKLFDTTLSKESSWYNKNLINRSINVELASKLINGTVLAPGEVFSYNNVVGERTAERGFKNAQIYVQSKVVEGLGGGICQVSSTLYNAVLYADLEVVERRWHSLPVTYVPLGQDATVAFGYIDFKFKNNRDYPIEVLSWCEKGNVYVSIKGTDDGIKREVKITNVTKQVLDYKEEVIEDKTLQPGQRVVVTKGKKGYVVDTYKKVYENGVLVSDKFLHTSKYNPTTQQVKVYSLVEESGATPEPIPSVTPSSPPEASTPPPTESASPSPSVSPDEPKPSETPPADLSDLFPPSDEEEDNLIPNEGT